MAFALPLLFAAGCTVSDLTPKADKPLPKKLVTTMKSKGMSISSPIMVRIFKEEGLLEIWKRKDTGRYDIVTSYNICKWSGRLGPKFMENDRQAPEGFYTVRPAQMNPKSSYHLSFNIGFPNAYDRAHGRSGGNLMVHGACSSAGCYSMSDEQVEEIFAFARDSFKGGQTEFQIQAFPFRMTAENMARYRGDPNYAFWQNLKEGYDHFQISKLPPKVDVCERRYVFNVNAPEGAAFSPTGACPPGLTQPESLKTAYESQKARETAAFDKVTANGKDGKRAPSIKGPQEAAVIAAWQKKRVQGQPVGNTPPYLPDTAIAFVTPAAEPETPAVAAAPSQPSPDASAVASIDPQQQAPEAASPAVEAPAQAQAASAATPAETATATSNPAETSTTVAFPPVPAAPDAASTEQRQATAPEKAEPTEAEAFAEAATTAEAQTSATAPAKKKRWWQVLGD